MGYMPYMAGVHNPYMPGLQAAFCDLRVILPRELDPGFELLVGCKGVQDYHLIPHS